MNMTVYRQMITEPNSLFAVLRKEIGLKTTCMPFAVKAMEALSSLGSLTQAEANKAANVFLDNLQTLNQGGIIAEDYDKIDFVKRGKAITISARVEAFLRAASRKGYRITETIIAVPNEDANTTYFKEQFFNGEIVYVLEDSRHCADRAITVKRLIDKYFNKFICRLDIFDIKQNKRIVMLNCEMSNDEILQIASVSEQGLYKSKWEEYKKYNGETGKRKVITNELNSGTFWVNWTGEMVAKTIIRRALKRVKEVLPELSETIYAFEREDGEYVQDLPIIDSTVIDIPVIELSKVDLNNLTVDQQGDADETLALFTANPKLASDKTNEILQLLENGTSLQDVINTHFASLVNIKKSKKLYPLLKPFLEPLESDFDDMLMCSVCGKEIKSEKSKKYYANNPDKPVKCYSCNKG